MLQWCNGSMPVSPDRRCGFDSRLRLHTKQRDAYIAHSLLAREENQIVKRGATGASFVLYAYTYKYLARPTETLNVKALGVFAFPRKEKLRTLISTGLARARKTLTKKFVRVFPFHATKYPLVFRRCFSGVTATCWSSQPRAAGSTPA